jgi:hypothetical protein
VAHLEELTAQEGDDVIPFLYGQRRIAVGADVTGPTVFGVENFRSWDLLLADDEYRRAFHWIGGSLVVGVLGGTLWGGWKGALAGLLSTGALANGIGTSVYLRQPDANYEKAAMFTGGVAAVETVIALWLSRKILEQREKEGRSAFGLAH